MGKVKFCSVIFILMAAGLSAARAQHVCDAPSEGGQVMTSTEVTDVNDGAPYRSGSDWLVERTTRFLPLCNYFSPVGSYSLKSYSLDPFTRIERVTLCHAATPVAPYAGPCPPK